MGVTDTFYISPKNALKWEPSINMCNHEHDHSAMGCCEHKSNEKCNLLWEEIQGHLPYAIFSVATALIFLSLITSSDANTNQAVTYKLFHNFHFIHLLFAATGTMLMFRRFSNSVWLGLLVGFFVPAVFCTISDAFLPYLGGKLINLDMEFHWCFITHLDTVLPFLLAGMLNGWLMSRNNVNKLQSYSFGFHFSHIFVSSMAAVLYLVSFGFYDWWHKMGFVFSYLILAVLIPCTMSDIIMPMLFAKIKSRK